MDYSKNTFPLNHFALYCKGWYEPVNKSMDYIQFISKILDMDGYCFVKNISSILNIVLSEIDRYNNWLRENNKPTLELQWLYNRAKMDQLLYDYDFERALLSVIKTFIMDRSKEEIVLIPPKYDRHLYKNGITFRYHNKGETYKERNDYANKMFNSCQIK